MRALLHVIALAAGTTVAHAQAPRAPSPGPSPGTRCQVTIVRAPDAVKATVEQWLANETCTVALTVRIIPTENSSLYVLATDPSGRVRERIVPDAQSAGVLVASWAADDGIVQPQPVAPPPSAIAPAPVAPAVTTAYGGEFHPPGATEPEDDDPVPEKRPAVPKHFITLDAGFGANDASGLHGEVDVIARDNYTLGLFAGGWSNHMLVTDYTYSPYGAQYQANVVDYTVGIEAGHTWRFADWHVRGGIAAGVMISSMTIYNADGLGGWFSGEGTAASPYGEAQLMIGHSLGAERHWAVEAGMIAGYSHQTWAVDSATNGMETLERDAGSFLFVGGLRYGL